MYFNGYRELYLYIHAYSLHVYFSHNLGTVKPVRTQKVVYEHTHSVLIYFSHNLGKMCTQKCINTFIHFLYIVCTIWALAQH